MRKYDYGKLNQREKNRLARLAEYYASVKGCSFEEQLESMVIQPGDEEPDLLIPRDEMTVDNPVLKAVATLADDLAVRMGGSRVHYQNVLLGFESLEAELSEDAITGDFFSRELHERCGQWIEVGKAAHDKVRGQNKFQDRVTIRACHQMTKTPEQRAEANKGLNDPAHGGHQTYQGLAAEVRRILDG